MGIAELLHKVRQLRAMREEQPQQDIPDDMTRDKQLRSLRRQRRVQNEQIEKEVLKREIEEFQRNEQRRHLWGVKGESKPLVHQDFNIMGGNQPKMLRQKMRFL